MGRRMALVLALIGGIGPGAAQTSPGPTPVDRMALRGAIACTWSMSDSPRQYEVFDLVRQTMITVGRTRHTGTEPPEAAIKALDKKAEELRLTSFEQSVLDTCVQREIERMLAWINRP